MFGLLGSPVPVESTGADDDPSAVGVGGKCGGGVLGAAPAAMAAAAPTISWSAGVMGTGKKIADNGPKRS